MQSDLLSLGQVAIVATVFSYQCGAAWMFEWLSQMSI